MPSSRKYLALAENAFLKELEFPAVYDRAADDVYEVDPLGFEELALCDGALDTRESRFPPEFLSFCLSEGVLVELETPQPRELLIGRNEVPSLRYLMVEVTDRCNLSCIHCYLGDTSGEDLPLRAVKTVLDEFEQMGGLRLVVTGGEPLLHPDFAGINALASGRAFRSILVTNGTIIDQASASTLRFDEVQVSLDGMKDGHDYVRGEGSFKRAIAGIEHLRRAGKPVSVATMVHRHNLDELDALEALVKRLGSISWTLDVPCEAGRMVGEERHLMPGLEEAAEELERAFGSEQHEPSGDWACGAHLACVKAGGMLTKCGFYEEWTGGPAMEGLRRAWKAMPRMRLSDLDCDCEFIFECGGGCRFRAERSSGRAAPDPLKCRQFGLAEPG
jgi:radical SAM protein with 4Fe4S-binding SPASM domain